VGSEQIANCRLPILSLASGMLTPQGGKRLLKIGKLAIGNRQLAICQLPTAQATRRSQLSSQEATTFADFTQIFKKHPRVEVSKRTMFSKSS
jgi:hypothetical protein